MSKITQIFKKGEKRLQRHYGPISLVQVITKFLESVMQKQQYSCFNCCNLLTNCQFGFCKGF